jgi:streptogramin lyase
MTIPISRPAGGALWRRVIAALVFVAVTGCGHTAAPPRAPVQSVLPIGGLTAPYDVSVDAAGDVFVTDVHGGRNGSNQVLELSTGSHTPKLLPYARATVLSDPAGTIWVIDGRQNPSRLVKLGANGAEQAVSPLPDLGRRGVINTVDAAGIVYGRNGGGAAADGDCCLPVHLVKEAPGSEIEAIPFPDIDILGGMAVDAVGNLYVGDGARKQVLKFSPGAGDPEVLPFPHLRSVIDVAVDARQAVYVVDGRQNQILKLAGGSGTPTVLPFTGLKRPGGVAVDAKGDVYVTDNGNRRVVKLAGT